MKKLILIALIATLCGGALIAQSSDDFTITVTVNYIDFSLRDAADAAPYPGWDLGNVNAGATVEMTTSATGDHIYVDNQSNVALDFAAYSTSAAPAACGYGTATAWSPGTSAGTDQYLLEMANGGVDTAPGTYTTIDGTAVGSADDFYSAIAGEGFHLYTQLGIPTVATDGCSHDIVVYVLAVAP